MMGGFRLPLAACSALYCRTPPHCRLLPLSLPSAPPFSQASACQRAEGGELSGTSWQHQRGRVSPSVLRSRSDSGCELDDESHGIAREEGKGMSCFLCLLPLLPLFLQRWFLNSLPRWQLKKTLKKWTEGFFLPVCGIQESLKF